MQLETPVDTLIRAARLAREGGALVVLNPAPFPKEPLPAELLALVDIITPNETEASMMAGISVTDEASALQAILKIQATGIKQVILTAGSKGAYTTEADRLVCIPSERVRAVDTTAAGDTFCGACASDSARDSRYGMPYTSPTAPPPSASRAWEPG